MGGVLIAGAIFGVTLLLADLRSFYVVMALACLVSLCAIGFADDWLKLTAGRRNAKSRDGLRSWEKLLFQLGVAALLGWFTYRYGVSKFAYANEFSAMARAVNLPGLKAWTREAGVFIENPEMLVLPAGVFVLVATLLITGFSNAVNLTDGMDGLASGITVIVAFLLMILCVIAGYNSQGFVLAKYLLVPHIPFSDELAVVAGAMVGACLGFLWFNCHPAQVFMGDTGSLPLGGLLAYLALVIRQEFLLLVVGGIFLLEIGSVVIQVGWFKLSGGKRVFRCARFTTTSTSAAGPSSRSSSAPGSSPPSSPPSPSPRSSCDESKVAGTLRVPFGGAASAQPPAVARYAAATAHGVRLLLLGVASSVSADRRRIQPFHPTVRGFPARGVRLDAPSNAQRPSRLRASPSSRKPHGLPLYSRPRATAAHRTRTMADEQAPGGGTSPLLHIDDDWKAEAQREKERLAKKRAAEAAPPAAAPAAGPQAPAAAGTPGQRQPLRPGEALPAGFEDLINSLTSRALMSMGAMPGPDGRAYVSLETARQQIDLLDVIEQKTAGNLDPEEKSNLASTLHELRTAYLEVAHAMRQQSIERGGTGMAA